ncbi:MAG: uracil-DNA glycosylase family protein [Acidiferrobacterales bacterium]|nr:uracil-DNA glycosylase family protein [Acidiferrobacterales bacterium]
MNKSEGSLKNLLGQVRACDHCIPSLPNEPRPVLQVSSNAKILIAGQAPGAKVHASGVPFDDASGDRLRAWMGIDKQQFYDPSLVAILPMGFCYPGKGKSGDLPPRKECAPLWREKLLAQMPSIKLTLVIGKYAMDWHLTDRPFKNLTETVRAWSRTADCLIPLPHPSPRNNIWLTKNDWFEAELIPELRKRVSKAIDPQAP